MAWPLILAGAAIGTSVGIAESSKPDLNKLDQDLKLDPEMFQMGTAGESAYANQILEAERRVAPGFQATQIATQNQEQMRQRQMGLADMLQAQAAGTAPSAAEMQMQAAQQQNVAAARSMAASAQGVSPAMALRSAQEAQTQANIATMQQTAQLRAQEQASGQQAYGQFLGAARGQDIGLATDQAQLTQQTSLANQQAAMQQQQMNDQMVQFYTQQGYARDQAQLMANMEMENMRTQNVLAASGISTQASGQQMDFYSNVMGAGANMVGAGAGAAAAALSDRKAKVKIKRSKKELDQLMDAIKAYKYKYKNPEHGEGERISPMADDLEKSKLGKAMVSQHESGYKMVDYGKGLGTMLASVARLNERLKKVEGDK